MDDVVNSGDPEEWLEETKQNRFETFRSDSVVDEHCRSCQYDPDPVIKRGSLEADLMVIGSYPTGEDFEAGRPFSGPAGELLEEMLGAIDLDWETDCYLSNALLCGGPGTSPTDESVSSCRVNVSRQIELVSPDTILGVGKYAYCSLYHESVSVDFRDNLGPQGNLPDHPWLKGVVTLHPGLIQNQEPGSEKKQQLKRLAWKHLQQLKDLLNENSGETHEKDGNDGDEN